MASNGRNGRSTNSNSEGRSNTTDPLNDSGPRNTHLIFCMIFIIISNKFSFYLELGQTASELSRTLETEKIRIRQLIEGMNLLTGALLKVYFFFFSKAQTERIL